MFTLPHNSILYLYKEAIDMSLGVFRLQGIIAQQIKAGSRVAFHTKRTERKHPHLNGL